MPSVQSTPCPVDIVRVPRENRPQHGRVEIKGGLQRWRVMQAQVGSEPVDDSGFRHAVNCARDVVFSDNMTERRVLD